MYMNKCELIVNITRLIQKIKFNVGWAEERNPTFIRSLPHYFLLAKLNINNYQRTPQVLGDE
jgi:hypothetical protein